MATYSLRDVRSMLGLSRSVVSALIAAGFVTPSRGPRREYRFSFQDMVLLRTAHQLQAAQVPARRILRSLRRLRASLPESMPLSGLRITAVGDEVAVREGGTHWHADSGQLLMDFEIAPASTPHPLAMLGKEQRGKRPPPAPSQMVTLPLVGHGASEDAEDWFSRATLLEASDPAAAERAYRRAIAADPSYVDAYLNLGVLLGESGRLHEAITLYRAAVRKAPADALLQFNLAVMLEDAGRAHEALAAYERSLAIDAQLADAHYNAARLYDRLGEQRKAIRHYSAYRRLSK